MSKMAVIGDSTSVLGFRPLGVDVFSLGKPEDVHEIWPSVSAGDYAVIMMTEPVFEAAGALVKRFEDQAVPAVLPIPSTAGPTGAGRRYIESLMEKAVGTVVKSKTR